MDEGVIEVWIAKVNRESEKSNLLRHILSSYLGIHESELFIQKKEFGKPFLPLESQAFLKFNVSHKDPWMAVALSLNSDIGLDIENMTQPLDEDVLIRKILTENELNRAYISRDLLFKIWCLKEAFVKASGFGLHFSFKNIETCLKDRTISIGKINDFDYSLKVIHDKDLPFWNANMIGHVVVFGELKKIKIYKLF